ncbi:neuropeptide FF receptor 1 [Nematostella vectensis]|uniref:neuropeptide FF receptor 1 n=1 Tax=Nematostella vectensis TaxID=45351 RepID=UPI00207720A3|nr:neuropeptide FF receptor 1 [Nematostella vectensis]XP_048580003.1 neuropeptide FF receptor 1 [Nematostella vectensis]XP_048580005.1 neuropeptide FF receptor 1 [Nematostella vectensis]XP_048580006.1 neuropeptide FF receptor 1 [Nematostella vectensis]XP_048580007.1 neuropeptide FF receptor 1 [Nematostella vectensis]XP_048580008.1 neuropeptide FF receptor 1 [Nematostella vectensis]XP_048580009.1 neuropeptide FF receptor 1 [Nematostella vectensis]XP_048580010.1 neuropeptide FF receptor 1 [Nem
MRNNTTGVREDLASDNGFFYARLICYVLIFIIGVIGNILVCLVVCRQRKMKNVTNYFIVNLAAADLAVLLICIPFDFGEIITNYWPYGSIMCKLVYPLQTMATTASVGTLVAISLNRFMAIVYPLRPQLTTTDAKKVITVVWVLSLALVSPYIAVLRMRGQHCQETFEERGMQAGAYTMAIFLLQYVLPLTLIGLSYVRIGRDLRRDKGSYSNDALQREQEKEAHKVVKVLTGVVITFALLMLPNHVVFIWIDFGRGGDHEYVNQIVSLGQILVYFNSATNPLIYNAVNEQFREGFRLYFKSWIDLLLKQHRDSMAVSGDGRPRRGLGKCAMCASDADTDEDVALNGTCISNYRRDNNNGSCASYSPKTNASEVNMTQADEVTRSLTKV